LEDGDEVRIRSTDDEVGAALAETECGLMLECEVDAGEQKADDDDGDGDG